MSAAESRWTVWVRGGGRGYGKVVRDEGDMTGREDSGGYSIEEQRDLFTWRS